MTRTLNLPNTARVWVYASQRALTPSEVLDIENQVSIFTAEWDAHGSKMESSFEILENRFLVLAANEDVTTASGCSIDKSVRVFQEISKTLGLNLFERANVFYEKDGTLHTVRFTEIEKLLTDNIINENTIVFDTLVDSVAKINHNFKTELKNTWLNRYLKS